MAVLESTRARVEPRTQFQVLLPALTIEVVLYIALAAAAFFVRFAFLDWAPLASDEAMQALASWHFVNGRPDAFTGSPLVFSGNALLFLLFRASDFWARALPALFGSALVLLPALLRRELGRPGALVASGLLVLSPSLVYFSRDTDAAIIAVTCALAAFAFTWRYLVDGTPRMLFGAAVAAALAFLGAREVWTVALALALGGGFILPRARGWFARPLARRDALGAGLLFGVVLLGIGTTLFMHRDGLGAAFDLFGAWLDGLRPGLAWYDPLRLLLVYDPLLLFFGTAAIVDLSFSVRALERERAPLFMLAFWAVLAFVLYTLGGDKNPARVVVVVVPLALLAGWFIGRWVSAFVADIAGSAEAVQSVVTQEVPVFLFAMALAAFLYILLADFATRGSVLAAEVVANVLRQGLTPELNGAVLILLTVIAVAAVSFLAVTSVGWARAKNIGLAVLLALLAIWTFRQMAMVNFTQARNPQDWLVLRATSPSVRDLVGDLESISGWRSGDAHTISILSDASLGPIPEWYLRDFRNARFVTHPTMVPEIQALIVPLNAPVQAGTLMSQRYRLEAVRSATQSINFVQWLVFRDAGQTDYSTAVLWIPQPQ